MASSGRDERAARGHRTGREGHGQEDTAEEGDRQAERTAQICP